MKKFSLGFVIGILVLVVGSYFFLISGALPVSTKGPPLPLERWVADQALQAAMKGNTDIESPYLGDPESLLAGAKIYKQNCAVCHGVPSSSATNIAKGMFPKPPQFFNDNESVTDDEIGKIYWYAKNGIRLTGMPGFIDTLSERELWQVSLFLKYMDKLSIEIKNSL